MQPRLFQESVSKKYMVSFEIISEYRNICSIFFVFWIVVYNDASRRPDPSAFTKLELWHSDVTTHFILYHDTTL